MPTSVKKRVFVFKEGGDERYSSSTSTSPRVVIHATLCSVAECWKELQNDL